MSDELSSSESSAAESPPSPKPQGAEPAADAVAPAVEDAASLQRRQVEFRDLVVVPLRAELLKYAQGLLKSLKDAEDATQDAMLAAWRANVVEKCDRDPKRILPYMIRAVFRTSKNVRRTNARARGAFERLFEWVGLRTLRPAAVMDQAIALAILDFTQRVLDEMDPPCAAAYIEVVLRGRKRKDAAKLLKTTISTLTIRERKATKEVRRRLKAAGYLSDAEVAREERRTRHEALRS